MGSDSGELDRLLQAAVERYSPEPRAGIEGRVLHGVRRQQRRTRFRWLTYVLVAPVLAAAVLLVRTHPAKPVERPRPPQVAKKHAPELSAAVREAPVVTRKRRRRTQAPPFPTPAPLTSEEEALREFVAARPRETQDLLAGKSDKPLQIEELQIPPLQGDL